MSERFSDRINEYAPRKRFGFEPTGYTGESSSNFKVPNFSGTESCRLLCCVSMPSICPLTDLKVHRFRHEHARTTCATGCTPSDGCVAELYDGGPTSWKAPLLGDGGFATGAGGRARPVQMFLPMNFGR
jgi:hypothetical protein